MAARKKQGKKTRLMYQAVRLIKCEGSALSTYIAMLAGTITFYMVFKQTWEIEGVNWWWLIFTIPLFGLSKVIEKLRTSQEPSLLVRFAEAFREGFLLLAIFASDLFKWTTRVREFLEGLRKKESNPKPNN
jgi:hypothetical protein